MSCDKCEMNRGVHAIGCPTNNEYELYICPKCKKARPQYSFSFGVCFWCQK